MSRSTTFALGALGGLLPILVSLLTVDFAPFIDGASQLSTGNYIGYGIRVAVLLVLGGVVAALNSDVRSPMALVQLGIAAPALITSYINGASVKQLVAQPTANSVHLSIVSRAYAEPISTNKNFRVAGGLFGDITQGFSTRLDQLQMEKSFDSNVAQPPPVLPPPIYAPSPSGWGAFCQTPVGRYGPNPAVPLGTPCAVPTASGVFNGVVVQ